MNSRWDFMRMCISPIVHSVHDVGGGVAYLLMLLLYFRKKKTIVVNKVI